MIIKLMKEYKHLSLCVKKKIELWNFLKSKIKSNVIFWTILVVILGVFMIGFLAFYNLIDNFGSESNVSEVCANNLNLENSSKEDFSEQEKINLKPITDFAENVDNLPSQSKKNSDKSNKKRPDDKCSEKNVSKESDFENTNSENENMDSKNKYDFSSWNKNCSYEQMVINKYNAIPDDIIVNTKVCRGKEVYISIADDLEQMIKDARNQDIILWISSGYRDINLQTKLFNRRVNAIMAKSTIAREEAEKLAAQSVAKPKTSEHNSGLAVDFNGVEQNFSSTKEYKWLMENAHKYGFIERYQKKWQDYTGVIYEPWHFRYVGKELALNIKNSGLCLEKYVSDYLIK